MYRERGEHSPLPMEAALGYCIDKDRSWFVPWRAAGGRDKVSMRSAVCIAISGWTRFGRRCLCWNDLLDDARRFELRIGRS